MTSRLPQLLDQLHRWLRHHHDAAGLNTDNDADPDHLVHLAATQLTHASHLAHQLSAALDTAHQALTHLGTGRQPDDVSNHTQRGQFSTAATGSIFGRC